MTNQYPFIDMHTHLFTARYLPLHGIFLSFGVPNALARGLARFSVSITGKSDFDTNRDDASEDDLLAALQGDSIDRLADEIVGRARTILRDFQAGTPLRADDPENVLTVLGGIDEFHRGLYPGDFQERPASDRILNDGPLSEESVFGGRRETFDLLDKLFGEGMARIGKILSEDESFHDVAHLHGAHDMDPGSADGFKKIGLSEDDIIGLPELLRFVGVMILSERNRYKALERDFAKGKPGNGLDATHYVGVLMDMYAAFARIWGYSTDKPYFDFKTQMQRMGALAKETGNRLISFAAVDPFRNRRWKENVDAGVHLGVRAFKIYPPQGYRPIEARGYTTPVNPKADETYAQHAARPAPSYSAQATLAEIIPYFAQQSLGLYAHCSPTGFEVRKGYGVYSDPKFWSLAMEAYGAQDLRLFLAHGGGAKDVDWCGWAAEEEDFKNTFAARAIEMVQTYENVYLGLGHVLSFIDDDAEKSDRARKRLKNALVEPKPPAAQYHFRNKVCFGTDWSMPLMIGKTRAFLNGFYDFFDDNEIRDYAPAFFETNARAFLKLGSSAA